ncbi:MAG: DUF1864 family protein [Pseudomonadales bacterium]|nr:DUF1864 family protein [Pseudomonadales bacterium]
MLMLCQSLNGERINHFFSPVANLQQVISSSPAGYALQEPLAYNHPTHYYAAMLRSNWRQQQPLLLLLALLPAPLPAWVTPMTANALAFDQWIRAEFIDLNTQLELQYQQQRDRANVEGIGEQQKQQLKAAGEALIGQLVAEGNTDDGFDQAFNLLGNVGLFMAACRRHEITEPSRETCSPLINGSALAMQIGASLGVIPRFATAHLTTHNQAINGTYKCFTRLPCEALFIDYNTRGILAYKRAADALLKILPLGISHPLTADLLKVAKRALIDVRESNKKLHSQLAADEFFYQVRPYYKPHYVGAHIYRGANAGDFAGINVIDMLLGLCFANETYYAQILVDKFLYMMPEDQAILRDCMRRPALMDDFLKATGQIKATWYQHHLRLFLEVCRCHGHIARQHQNLLIDKFISTPANELAAKHLDKLTASGPPLQTLVDELKVLTDHRTAAKSNNFHTRYNDIKLLNSTLRKK